MHKSALFAAATLVLAGLAHPVAAQVAPDSYVIQLDDRTDTIYGNTYKNGVLIQSAPFSQNLNAPYGIWSGATLRYDFDFQDNILEYPGGPLSDSLELISVAGTSSLSFNFQSDPYGTYYPNGTTFAETGGWQTVAAFTVSNGDQYLIQFLSSVPEPTTWAMVILGLGLVGTSLRRRGGAVAAA